MNYFYYPPISKSYYLPLRGSNSVYSFYKPYSYSSKILWGLQKIIPVIRKLFVVSIAEFPFLIEEIKKFLENSGVELAIKMPNEKNFKKYTCLVVFENKNSCIVKFAFDEESMKMIQNEINILTQLPDCEMFPKLLKFKIDNNIAIPWI